MALFIVGGSNSLFRDGWVAELDGARNLSVGATTTLCGIFRCLQQEGPRPGDTVVWEYGINETVHGRSLYAPQTILRNLEHFIRLAGLRGWKLLPLMLTPLPEERRGLPPYHGAALALFRDYGLSVVEANAVFRKTLGSVPADHYQDPVHYRRCPQVSGAIGRMVSDSLHRAAVPIQRPAAHAQGVMRSLALRGSSRFRNSIMSLPLTRLPLRLRLEGRGTVRSLVALCRPGIPSGIRVRLVRDGQALADARISTTCRVDKTLLKALNLDDLGDWSYRPGDILALRFISAGGLLHAEPGLARRVSDVIAPADDALAGILVESLEDG